MERKRRRKDRNVEGPGSGKERIAEGYRERVKQRKGIKTTEEGQRVRTRDCETERDRKRERERETETETGGKISL